MTYLFPGIRPPTKLASGVPDGTTRRALASVEAWAAEVSERLSRVTAIQVSGLVVPIAESDVTWLVADLAARPTGSGTSGKSTRWTGTSVLGDGAFLDDGINVSLAGNLTLSTFTAGSVLFAGTGGLVSQDDANLFWDDANNRLGVGNAAPATTLDVTGIGAFSTGLFVGTTVRTQNDPALGFLDTDVEFTQDDTNTVIASTYSATGNAAFQVFRARGTKSASSAVLSGDSLGSFGFTGATSATAHHSGAFLIATATENWVTGSNVGTKLDIYTTKRATSPVTGRAVRLTIADDGTVVIPGAVNNGTTALIVGAAANTKTTTVGVAEFTKDATALFTVSAFGTGAVPALNFLHGRGTAVATTAAQSGDILGQIIFAGATGPNASNTLGSSFISGLATENWSPGTGSKIQFTTCLNGSTTRNAKLTIENDGGITLSSSSSAAVGAAGTSVLRSNTQLQVSNNGGAYVTISTGTGTAGVHTKWSNATGLLVDSLISDTGSSVTMGTANTQSHTIQGKTTVNSNGSSTDTLVVQSSNAAGFSSVLFKDNGGTNKGALGYANASASDTNVAGKFYWHSLGGTDTVFARGSGTPSTRALTLFDATGNVNIGTATTDPSVKLQVQGTSILDGQVDVNSHKIVNLTNGSSAQDAAAFGQIETAVNAAVSGTANTLAKFTSTNVVGNSSITDDGAGIVDINADLVKFGSSADGSIYVFSGIFGGGYANNADADVSFNYLGYNAGPTKYRSFVLYDGKTNLVARFNGPDKATSLYGDLTVNGATTLQGALVANGDVALGDAAGDTLKFYGGTGATQQTITGSRGGNAALADLLTKLATLGLIVDSTSA